MDVNIEDIIEFPNNVLEEKIYFNNFIIKKWSNN